MINAGSGITPGVDGTPPAYYSLGVAETLLAALDVYRNVLPVRRYREIYQDTVAVLNDPALTAFKGLSAANFPALTDAAPYPGSGFAGTTVNDSEDPGPPDWGVPYAPAERFMSNLVLTNARLVMGYSNPNGSGEARDLTKFIQIQNICNAYRGQANTMVNSSVNSAVVATTFTGMQELSTGGVSQVTPAFDQFGGDLVNLGNLINLRTLPYLGYPSNLLRQMLSVGGLLPGVYDALTLVGVTDQNIAAVKQSTASVELNLEVKIYRALMMVTGEALTQVLELLDISQSNANDPALTQPFTFANAADLLNPAKILPNSYLTLVMQLPGTDGKTQDVKIYSAANTVNSYIAGAFVDDEIYINLRKVIPAAQALANAAFIRSMQQIKNIVNLEFQEFAASTRLLENNDGLSEVNALAAPIPTTVQTEINGAFATGTGPNGTLTLYDLIGTAAGWIHADAFLKAAEIISAMTTTTLVDLYALMENTIAGDYTTYYPPVVGPPSSPAYWETVVPGGGTYVSYVSEANSISLAVNDMTSVGLVPRMQVAVSAIVSAYPDGVAECNQLWSDMAAQLNREAENRYLAELIYDFDSQSYPDIRGNSRSSALALINSLHSIGTDAAENGPADFFNATAQTDNLGGQSVIASLREGRNIAALADAGVGVDTQLPTG